MVGVGILVSFLLQHSLSFMCDATVCYRGVYIEYNREFANHISTSSGAHYTRIHRLVPYFCWCHVSLSRLIRRNKASRAMWPSSWRLKACPCPRRPRNEGPWRSRCMYLGTTSTDPAGGFPWEKSMGEVVDLIYLIYLPIWVVVSHIFYVHPYLGKWSNLTNIFQMGWNHQLDYLYLDDLVLEGWFVMVNCKSKYIY